MRFALLSALALALQLFAVACEPAPDCGTGDAPATLTPGFTGIAVCLNEGKCQTFDKSCSVDDECFEPLGERNVPTWSRPQGGVGTRLNVRLEGDVVSNDGDTYGSVRTLIVGEIEQAGGDTISCAVEDCACSNGPNQGPCTAEDVPNCPCNVGAEFGCAREVPGNGDVCAVVIADQASRQFPLVCSTDGSVHIEEMPVQFRSRWRNPEELDGAEATLFSIVEVESADPVVGSATITFTASEFIRPSWFDLGAPQPR